MKKFYKLVTTNQHGDRWQICLDGKPVKTPVNNALETASYALAEAMVMEWHNQHDTIHPETMPVTQILMTMIDRVIPNRERLEQEILGYIDTDLICYRTDDPEVYAAAQRKAWDPLVKWVEAEFGQTLTTTLELQPITQTIELRSAVTNYVQSLSPEEFTALYIATQGTGSLYMAIAALSGEFSPETLFEAALIEDLTKDGIYLAETYGISTDQERKRAILKRELGDITTFLEKFRV